MVRGVGGGGGVFDPNCDVESKFGQTNLVGVGAVDQTFDVESQSAQNSKLVRWSGDGRV